MAVRECIPDAKPCIMRATRLNEFCQYEVGPNNSVTTSGIVSFNAEPEIEEGAEQELLNGCGEVCASTKDPDRIKRINLDFEICFKDPDLLNILTCSSDLLDTDGYTLGTRTKIGTVDCPGAFLEIWTKKIRPAGICGDVSTGAYNFRRYTFHRAVFTPGSINLSNDFSAATLSGYTEANPNALDGPFSDMPFVGEIESDDGMLCFDDTFTPTPGCGYTEDVPLDANT